MKDKCEWIGRVLQLAEKIQRENITHKKGLKGEIVEVKKI